jgi:Rieske Fe-S protein
MEERYRRLEAWARRHFPECGDVRYRWSGQVFEPFDGLAFIGRDPGNDDNVLIATGDSGMGMTHGTIAGMLLTDLAMGRENGWAELYDPARKQTGRVGVWLRENLNVARQMADHLRPSEVADEADIAPGSGAVMRQGMDRLAVHRDEESRLHRLSAVCTHLKCIVHWNPGEKTWDCPCHGSRFSATGTVVAGPAHHDLARR